VGRRSFDHATLRPLREMASEDALALLAIYYKVDSTYVPANDPRSRRWHARTAAGEFELLTTGQKWWDTRAEKGGGGAIDLAMHLLQLPSLRPLRPSSNVVFLVVEIVRKGELPQPGEVPEGLREAATAALNMKLREARPLGFPLLFSSDMRIIEPAVAFLHEHAIQRAHSADTVRTYTEILFDWFDTLEQSGILWSDADAVDLVAYRNRMLRKPSPHTQRPYSVRTINHRVRGVLRFYAWAVRNSWLRVSPLAGRATDFAVSPRHLSHRRYAADPDRSVFVLRQFEDLPRPLTSAQARELLAELPPPYDLMARWQLYTGLRVSELLRLTVQDVRASELARRSTPGAGYRRIDVVRKGRKNGYVIAPTTLLEETAAYLAQYRAAWLRRATRKRRALPRSELFINRRGIPVRKNTYQRVIHRVGGVCGFRATTHLMRATFACMMLSRLERLAKQGAAINPLLIVKILMSHQAIESTDRYLRAVAIDTYVLADVLDGLLAGNQSDAT
jgi:site-specific recombinase XerD